MAGGDFLFVNTSNPDQFRDKEIKRTVRKRVMRDIGKARRKPKCSPTLHFTLQPLNLPNTPKSPSPSPSPCLYSNSLPVDLDARALELIHFMNAEAEYNYRPFRKIWFSMALSDRSAFILCKANASMFLEETRHPDTFCYEKCQETLVYYGQCVRQVTDRLSDPLENTSEGILTSILGLICHDLYAGTLDRWAYHIQGLAQVIKLRGGFCGLDEKVQLFASWFDVLGSVAKDTTPRLPRCPGYLNDLVEDANHEPEFEYVLDELKTSPVEMEDLAAVLRKARVLATYINNRCNLPGFWRVEDDLSPLQVLGPITHDLLSISRADSLAPSGVELVREMTRLALLILLSGIKAKYGFSAIEIDFLKNKYVGLLQNMTIEHKTLPFQRLQLWALVIVAMLQPDGPERNILAEEISSRMTLLNITGGQSVINLARNMIWIEILAQDTVVSLIDDIDIFYSRIHANVASPTPSTTSDPATDRDNLSSNPPTFLRNQK